MEYMYILYVNVFVHINICKYVVVMCLMTLLYLII